MKSQLNTKALFIVYTPIKGITSVSMPELLFSINCLSSRHLSFLSVLFGPVTIISVFFMGFPATLLVTFVMRKYYRKYFLRVSKLECQLHDVCLT